MPDNINKGVQIADTNPLSIVIKMSMNAIVFVFVIVLLLNNTFWVKPRAVGRSLSPGP